MVAKNSLNPNRLPPTIAATTEHILGAYLQYHNWVMLILDFVCCNCSVDMKQLCLTLRCSCKKCGFNCLPDCGRCHGVNCTNARQDILEEQDILKEQGSFD